MPSIDVRAQTEVILQEIPLIGKTRKRRQLSRHSRHSRRARLLSTLLLGTALERSHYRQLDILLDDLGNPVAEPDWKRFSDGFRIEKSGSFIKLYNIAGGVWIHTRFIGADQSSGRGPPMLWGTVIFGGHHNHYVQRDSTVQRRSKVTKRL